MAVRELPQSGVGTRPEPVRLVEYEPLVTAPNLLTMARVPLGVMFAFSARSTVASFAIMGLAGLTDVLDGWLARRRRHRLARTAAAPLVDQPGRGAWLDPLCDKLFLGSVLVSIYVTRPVPAHLLMLIATRELIQAPLAMVYRLSGSLRRHMAYDFRSNPLGKLATVVQFVAVGAIMLRSPASPAVAVAAAAVGALAVASYVRRAIFGYFGR